MEKILYDREIVIAFKSYLIWLGDAEEEALARQRLVAKLLHAGYQVEPALTFLKARIRNPMEQRGLGTLCRTLAK